MSVIDLLPSNLVFTLCWAAAFALCGRPFVLYLVLLQLHFHLLFHCQTGALLSLPHPQLHLHSLHRLFGFGSLHGGAWSPVGVSGDNAWRSPGRVSQSAVGGALKYCTD